MKKVIIFSILFISLLDAKTYEKVSFEKIISLVKEQNIEISIAKADEKIKELEVSQVTGKNFGSLDLVQNIFRSNDAGTVFGYKLTNREATFRDFGFSDFDMNNPNLLDTQPDDLNYPDARNFFQTKLQYSLPLYTGGKLSNYKKIKSSLQKIASLDREKISHEKIYQAKKSFSDIVLLDEFIKNLTIIRSNIDKLENMSLSMQKEGYAKKVDVLEVKSKKANVLRMLNQSKANKKLALEFLSFLANSDIISIDAKTFTSPKSLHVKKDDVKNLIDYKKASEGVKLANSQLSLSKSGFLPTIGLMAEYGSSDEKFLKNFSDHDNYTVGAQIKWNIFNGLQDANGYEKARIGNLKAKNRLALAKSGLWLKISKLQTEIEKRNYDIESVKAELALANDIYENYSQRYAESLVSINDVLIKQSAQIELTLKLKELQNKKYDALFKLNSLLNGDK